MLKIGEFSKLSMLTVKALRFYEKEGLLSPARVDEWTGYRTYDTVQLRTAARIKALRQLGVPIDQIRAILDGADERKILLEQARMLQGQQAEIARNLSMIYHLLEGNGMKHQVTEKTIPSCIVYYSEATLAQYSDAMQRIPAQGAEAKALNPDLKCAEPPYEFVEYLDCEHREADVRVRHSEAVEAFGTESDNIKFREVPETKVLSIYHQGAYENLGEAYAFIYKYAEDNGCKVAGFSRESYIDGIWNKESVDEWLTEIQLPVE